jgi:hypothetical protein
VNDTRNSHLGLPETLQLPPLLRPISEKGTGPCATPCTAEDGSVNGLSENQPSEALGPLSTRGRELVMGPQKGFSSIYRSILAQGSSIKF